MTPYWSKILRVKHFDPTCRTRSESISFLVSADIKENCRGVLTCKNLPGSGTDMFSEEFTILKHSFDKKTE